MGYLIHQHHWSVPHTIMFTW